MNKRLVAQASATINAPIAQVWDALVNPEMIRKYMSATEVISDWKKGSTIVWKGVWKQKAYEDKGIILTIKPEKKLQYSHFSSLAGLPDEWENYHVVTYDLSIENGQTLVWLSQNNNASEKEKEHAEKTWETLLAGLKKVVEENSPVLQNSSLT